MKAFSLLPYSLEAPGLSPGRKVFMGECAAVCLERSSHRSGVRLSVRGETLAEFHLKWTPLTPQHFRSCGDPQEATEHGAYAVAILVITHITGKKVVERSAKGTGFDYWLGETADELPFQGMVRLEVSGILDGSDRDVATRIREKLSQVSVTDAIGPAYIAVVEFGTPTTTVNRK